MISPFKAVVLSALSFSISLPGLAQDAVKEAPKAAPKKAQKLNEKCPIEGKAVKAGCTTEYEGKTYAFCCGECRTKFTEARADSLYQKLGGQPAISAAVDIFYKKVLADEVVNEFFEGVNMKRQAKKQKAFFSAALGGPEPWKGKDMLKAHEGMGITEAQFNAIATHLVESLKELEVEQTLIDEVLAVVATTKDDVVEDEPEDGEKPKKKAS